MIGQSGKPGHVILARLTRLRTALQTDQPRRLLILVIGLAVLLQLLGVPAPLLNAGGMFDIAEASVLEGVAIPPTCLQWTPSSQSALIPSSHSSVHVPLLAASLFHPPLV
jgi:hypothetical protein